MSVVTKLVSLIRFVKFKYLLSNSIIKGMATSKLYISTSSSISNCIITVHENSSLTIADGCRLEYLTMSIRGHVFIGSNNLLIGTKYSRLLFFIEDGTLDIGDFNRVKAKIVIRFGGKVSIGHHNNINDNTELRADESLYIGSYNQISYDCVFWDTNTHNIYEDSYRRKLTNDFFPSFGYEFERPKTKPVYIGNDCWIGRGVSILKGVTVNNSVIVGFGTTLSNCEIPENKVVVTKIENNISDRKR